MAAHAGHRHTEHCHHEAGPGDLAFLAALTSSAPRQLRASPLKSRRPALDPLILQTAAASGPHVTRNHYMHDCYPHASQYSRCDEEPEPQLGTSPDCRPPTPPRLTMQSKQAPRRIRLAQPAPTEPASSPPKATLPLPKLNGTTRRRSSAAQTGELVRALRSGSSTAPTSRANGINGDAKVKVVCHARTRVPTPHGDVLLHLYKNDRDAKEHLAFVFDRPQLTASGDADLYLRSRSLDAVWRPGETDEERVVRGAYVGRLGPQHAVASTSQSSKPASTAAPPNSPLVRIHSECFTGETIGSQRCDCGEQLDEAFRLAASTRLGRGIVVYLRQEGRGIGLLEKLRAYNLQDLGHDTVTANLLLGHGADMRTYGVAAAILADLGVSDVRLLTNNPDKIEQLATEGVRVSERVPMVPRHWRARATTPTTSDSGEDDVEEREARQRRSGVGMIGAGETTSPELERYLATKASKMGHLLERPVLSQAPSMENLARRRATKQRATAPSEDTLADSVASLATAGSIDCDEECECQQPS